MSDEQTSGQSAATQLAADVAKLLNNGWRQPITEERQAELQGYLDRWEAETDHGKRKGPYDGVKLSGADTYWMAEQSQRDISYELPNFHLEGPTCT
jgi:hypothetical protein